jgi:hypothetical protein
MILVMRQNIFRFALLTGIWALLCASGGVLVSSDVRADSATPGGPSCLCRYQGQRYELGQFACINSKLARCDMFLNNTSWTFLEDTCPTAQLTPLPQSTPMSVPASG